MNTEQQVFGMNEYTHFMLDIETLGVGDNAAITEIGACTVVLSGPVETFWQECVDMFAERDTATMKWRLDNNLPWKEYGAEGVGSILPTLEHFFRWITKVTRPGTKPFIWCKGTDFDISLIKQAWKRCGCREKDIPWQYNHIGDIRTLLHVFPQFKIPKESVKHNGLDDALSQSAQLRDISEFIYNLQHGPVQGNSA